MSATVQSKPTSADAAAYFIDNVIERSLSGSFVYIEVFEKLLAVMEEFNTQPLKQLSSSIRQQLAGESSTWLWVSISWPSEEESIGQQFWYREYNTD